MSSKLNPYLGFQDQAKDAMELYRSVFGGELTSSTFGEMGMGDGDEAAKIMHSQLETPAGYTLMAADNPNSMEAGDGRSNHSVSLSGGPEDDEELSGYFAGLAEGGMVALPLEKAPWGDKFGMVIDRFGVQWMVNIAGEQAS